MNLFLAVAEDKRDEKRKPPTEDQSDRGSSKRHKSDRDRSRERGRVDRERDRDKRISYDQVSYSGDSYDKYDRYAAATADARDFGKSRRGKDGEKDEKSRRGYEYEKDLEAKDREKKKERDEHDKERERRKEKDEKESERRKDRDEDVGDKDRRKERDRGREKERSRSRDRSRMDKDSSKKGDDPGKERDRRDDRGEQRRRSRSRDRNRGKEGSDRHDDRKKDKDRHDRDRDAHSKSGPGEAKTRNSYDKEEIMLQDDEEDLEAIRKKRAAILEKIKNKSAANGSQPNGNQPGTISRNQSMEDIFEDQKSEPQKSDDQKVQDSGGNKSTQAEAEDVEDKDEIDTATVFAAKEHAGAESDEDGQDDMFTNSPARGKTGGAAKAVQRQKDGEEMDRSGLEEDRVDRRLGDTNADNWDDSEGYFRTRPGELIIGRYLVNRDIGNGVYSTVLSAADQQTSREVAIKVVRSNETMTSAGKKEIEILKKLGAEDPEGRRHICKLLSHFEYKNHLCMVFVPLEMNLRKLLKTYGRSEMFSLA
jgi:serine/threonine-protein kinase PRP4